MIPSSYKNFNLFKHHLGRGGNGYVQDMTDKAKLCLPLCEGVSNSHYIFLLHFFFICLVYLLIIERSSPTDVLQATCLPFSKISAFLWFYFFMVLPHAPTSLSVLL